MVPSSASVDGLQLAQRVTEVELGTATGLEALLEKLCRALLCCLTPNELLEQGRICAYIGRSCQADGVDG